MKGQKQNIGIRELFSEKLENAEVIPDASIRFDLMRRVGKREFLRFNPSRFNIYYLGGILVAGVAAALILTSDPSKNDIDRSILQHSEIEQIADTNILSVPVEKPVDQKPESLKTVPSKEDQNKQVNKLPAKLSDKTSDEPILQNNLEINSRKIAEPISGKVIYAVADSEKNKLKGRLRQSENLIEASVREGCTPLKVRFTINLGSYDSCRWSFGDGGFSDNHNPEWIYDVDGEYKVDLTLFGRDGSQITSSVVITVHPRPSARFEISQADAGRSDNMIRFSNYSSNAVRFRWDFGDGNSSASFEPVYKYPKSGNYNVTLVASSEYGCSDSLIVLNALTGLMYYISFPNAFIPNQGGPTGGYYSPKSDEAAQVFHPVFSGVAEYQLRIFSKMGIIIFETNDIHVGWDGYFKGQLSEQGVYIWKVRGSYLNGEPFTKMGDVTLLKN